MARHSERVLSVHHWTDRLFSFTTTRDMAFRFKNGQFTMIGLEVAGKPLLRAYSMVSANFEEELSFLSIKVPDGPLTSRLQHIQPGDAVLVGRKPTGTLIQDNLLPGKRLFLFATGTGLAPFMSIIKDPDIYDAFPQVILVHCVREVAELAYYDMITRELPNNEFLGPLVTNQLLYYPTVTRENFRNQGRITDLFESGKLHSSLGLSGFDRTIDRFMLCGNPGLLSDGVAMLKARELKEGSSSTPGHYTIEKAFVEQ